MKCGNTACSAGNVLTVVDPLGGDESTSISIGTDGLPVVSYWDQANQDLKVAKCGNAACSVGNAITTVDSAGNVGRYSSITVGPDGFPVVAYFDATNTDLKAIKCANALCLPNWTRR